MTFRNELMAGTALAGLPRKVVHRRVQDSADRGTAVGSPDQPNVDLNAPIVLAKTSDNDIALPAHLLEVLASSPANVDRRAAAKLISRHLYPVSHRSLEAWHLPTRHVNGRAISPTEAVLKHAYAKWVDAPVIMGGRRATTNTLEVNSACSDTSTSTPKTEKET